MIKYGKVSPYGIEVFNLFFKIDEAIEAASLARSKHITIPFPREGSNPWLFRKVCQEDALRVSSVMHDKVTSECSAEAIEPKKA